MAERLCVSTLRRYAVSPVCACRPQVLALPELPASDQPRNRDVVCQHQAAADDVVFALYLLTQTKSGMAALELSRHLGVCYRTAWRIKQKLTMCTWAASTREANPAEARQTSARSWWRCRPTRMAIWVSVWRSRWGAQPRPRWTNGLHGTCARMRRPTATDWERSVLASTRIMLTPSWIAAVAKPEPKWPARAG